ncbi:MAG: class I tRNA ligase family protein, partial [Thermoleophilaceae bacterium]|nr:class I tRNA ligase family protein [Thermoleophilaceae bacterium]
LTLWNTFGFLVMYANTGDQDGAGARPPAERGDLDRWALSRLQSTVRTVADRLDDYDATAAGKAIDELVDDLSNWYVRSSRRRFWDAEPDAIATLRECLTTISQLIAPFTPFIADEIYSKLAGSEGAESVHLTDFPRPNLELDDSRLEADMATARQAVELARAARAQAKVKIRQPLGEIVVVATGEEQAAIARFEELILTELNVKTVRYVTDADELARFEIKPNFKALGPRLGKNMPLAKEAIAALDGAKANENLKNGEPIRLAVAGEDFLLGPEDVQVVLAPLDGYQLEREGTHAVALDLTVTDALKREGLAREIVHAVQNARKDTGLAVEDRIDLQLGGEEALMAAASEHEEYLAAETLATSVGIGVADDDDGEVAAIDGMELTIKVVKA